MKITKHLRFLRTTPLAGVRILWGTALARVMGVDRVRNAQLALTFKCNHKCLMCSSSNFLRDENELSAAEWMSVADQLHDLGCVHYDITGGEPTLKGLDFLTKLISYINRRNDCIIDIATNGSIVDDRWFKQLREAGLNSIMFDLQSDTAIEHDTIVGDKGNFGRIMDLIPQAKDAGLNVCINTCFSKDNLRQMEGLREYCVKNNLLLLLNLAAPTGRLSGKDVRLSEYRESYYKFLNSSPNVRSDTSFNYRGSNLCPGGIEKIYVTAYGDVMQCTFCQLSYGNMRSEKFKVIYDRMRRNPYVSERSVCKHTFNEKFRREYLDKYMDVKNPPVAIYDKRKV